MSTAARRVIELLGAEIHVGPGLLDEVGRIAAARAPAHAYAVITDENVGAVAGSRVVESIRHVAPGARVLLQAIPAGEREKTRETWIRLTDWLLAERCGRDTTVIALGGGVVGDLAGFVAATFMRGVPVVQVPTSLLAMVDASVGGKTGVDTPSGKNLVGAFHQPAAVVVDPTVLQTLPPEQLRAGFAEVVKHGVIADAAYFGRAAAAGASFARAGAAWHGDELATLVADSIRIKATVVGADERERGGREVLNFGHTIGHAIELATGYGILHGEAVAIGMCLEARLAERLSLATEPVASPIRAAVAAIGLPGRIPPGVAATTLVDAMRLDKKARAGTLRFALPRVIGRVTPGIAVEPSAIRAVIEEDG